MTPELFEKLNELCPPESLHFNKKPCDERAWERDYQGVAVLSFFPNEDYPVFDLVFTEFRNAIPTILERTINYEEPEYVDFLVNEKPANFEFVVRYFLRTRETHVLSFMEDHYPLIKKIIRDYVAENPSYLSSFPDDNNRELETIMEYLE